MIFCVQKVDFPVEKHDFSTEKYDFLLEKYDLPAQNSYLPFQFETLFNLSNNLAPNLLTLLYFTLMKFPENSCGK